jgi:hypothetical protein
MAEEQHTTTPGSAEPDDRTLVDRHKLRHHTEQSLAAFRHESRALDGGGDVLRGRFLMDESAEHLDHLGQARSQSVDETGVNGGLTAHL